MIETAIKKSFELAKIRNWDKTFWAIDIHETLIKPNYIKEVIPTEWYPLALKALKLISDRADICTILFTCSHPSEIQKYLEFFKLSNINFDFVNKNPEVKTQENGYGYYEDKMYLNVLMDDKSGFDANIDWKYVIAAIEKRDHIFDPTDWGFVLTEKHNYEFKYNNQIILRITPNINDWTFEVISLTSDYYRLYYNGPITSMRHGDNTISTVFKNYNLIDKTYN